MKSFKFMLLSALVIISSSLFAQQSNPSNTDTIKVFGECGMCKNRIQKSLKLEGISAAEWNADTKLLTVSYNPGKITNDEIQQKLAAVGHDTEKYKADDKVYNKLPGCCLYERESKKDNLKNK